MSELQNAFLCFVVLSVMYNVNLYHSIGVSPLASR